jgi:hypothetical protein
VFDPNPTLLVLFAGAVFVLLLLLTAVTSRD